MHSIVPSADTVADTFDNSHRPVEVVNPGAVVQVGSLDASGHLERPSEPGEVMPLLLPQRRGHCLTGPIGVAGAAPGDTLAVRIDDLQPGEWGWTVASRGRSRVDELLGLDESLTEHLLWSIDAEAGTATESRGFRVPISPFLGVLGTAPELPGSHSTTPPRRETGGNIDCRELVAGSVLYLPVRVPEALLYVGDGHAAQGDGEVAGTAIECPMTATLTLDLITEPALDGVHAETPEGLVTFGFADDLDSAMEEALEAMITWLERLYAVRRPIALGLASAVVDLRITQVANETWGVHAVLPHGALEPV